MMLLWSFWVISVKVFRYHGKLNKAFLFFFVWGETGNFKEFGGRAEEEKKKKNRTIEGDLICQKKKQPSLLSSKIFHFPS